MAVGEGFEVHTLCEGHGVPASGPDASVTSVGSFDPLSKTP